MPCDILGRLLRAAALCGALLLPSVPAGAQAPDEYAYRIAPGDTLIGIAADFLTQPADWLRLQRLNGIDDALRLRPGTVLRLPLAWLSRSPMTAAVAFVHGTALLQRPGAPALALRPGDTVGGGDRLLVGADSSLTLALHEGSRIVVTADSEIVIVHLLALGKARVPSVQLRVDRGNAELRVPPTGEPRRFEIRTPAVNLGVRGTEFRARVDPGGTVTRLEVLRGRVAGSAAPAAAAVEIGAGLGIVAPAGRPLPPPQRLLPAPDLSGVAGRIDRLPLRFAWRPLAGATAYRAQVLPAADENAVLLDGRFDGPEARFAGLPDGRYRLRVRGLDAQALEGLDASTVFILKARPEAPLMIEPAPGASVLGGGIRFAWARVAGARRYRLQVSATPDFTAPLLDDDTLTEPGRSLDLPPGSWHWRVATIGVDADGRDDPGPFGDTQSFVQRALPPAPEAQSGPAPGGIEIRWRTPPLGQQVQVQVAADAGFERLLLDRRSADASVRLPPPAPGTYFVRLKTIESDGLEGPWGAPQQFEVPLSKWWLLLPLGLLLLVGL